MQGISTVVKTGTDSLRLQRISISPNNFLWKAENLIEKKKKERKKQWYRQHFENLIRGWCKIFERKKVSDCQQKVEGEMNTGLNISESHMNEVPQGRYIHLG